MKTSATAPSTHLSIYKCLWLVGLCLFFFSSYNLTNSFTASRANVTSIVFGWESLIPLWSWTIVPYWSIDLMYGLAILLATSKQSVKILCLRLLTAQIICIGCFLLFPLKFSYERPALDGFFGWLFEVLMGFDKPFNQAPSLHITLLVILWQFYAGYFKSVATKYLLNIWCLLIALSVLTTWQHHFFDIPTGLWVGCLCIWLWPDNGQSLFKNASRLKNGKWVTLYSVFALITYGLAVYFKHEALWLLWLAGALVLVAINYLLLGAKGFQKQPNGRFMLAIAILYLPYWVVMWLNSRLWTINHASPDMIEDKLYLGRIAETKTLKAYQFVSVLDLCAELPIAHFKGNYTLIPVLDMTPLTAAQCQQSAEVINQYYQKGKLLVCCALGYSRSATAVIAWLLWTHRAQNLDEAIAKVKACRSSIVISKAQRVILTEWFLQLKKG